MGRVAALSTKTTSPNLLSKGFLRQYRQMAQVAAVLAVLMLIFAALEGLGRGEPGMLWRVVLVNVPVAALATSAAYVLVQLLIATTDGFSEVVAHSTSADMRDFFKSAIRTLAGLGGANGSPTLAAGVPLFVSFIAASVAALAAFLVWVELLMRDAANLRRGAVHAAGAGGLDLAPLDGRAAAHGRADRGRRLLEVRHRRHNRPRREPPGKHRRQGRARPRGRGADAARLLRYGQRARTIVNNHRAKVFASGIGDPDTLRYVNEIVGQGEFHEHSETTKQRGSTASTHRRAFRDLTSANVVRGARSGSALLVYGHLPPARLSLRPWFSDPTLSALVKGDVR